MEEICKVEPSPRGRGIGGIPSSPAAVSIRIVSSHFEASLRLCCCYSEYILKLCVDVMLMLSRFFFLLSCWKYIEASLALT